MKRDEVELAFARLKAAYIRQAHARRIYKATQFGSSEAQKWAAAVIECGTELARAKKTVEDALDAYYGTEEA